MKTEFKEQFVHLWNKYFGEAPLPIGIFYSNHPHGTEAAERHGGNRCIIAGLAKVFKGKALAFNAGNIGCGGGLRYCGFTDELRPGFEYFLSYGIEGKMEGERYKKDPATVLELISKSPKMKAPAKWLIAKPFAMLTEEDNPEIILFLATPDVLAGLFTLANYDSADHHGVKSPFCAGCGSAIQYPYLENQSTNPDCILGLFDPSARPYIPAGTVSFAIPMNRFTQIVGYMEESFLITKTWETLKYRIDKENSR